MSHWEAPGKSNEWLTPPFVFEALGCQFDTDVASCKAGDHVPAKQRIWAYSLEASWDAFAFIWMNPPFGGRNALSPWLDKFFDHGDGIALVPDRTSAPWFRIAWHKTDLAMFTPKIKFLRPDGSRGRSPSNGTALLAVGVQGVRALVRAEKAGLGILASPG